MQSVKKLVCLLGLMVAPSVFALPYTDFDVVNSSVNTTTPYNGTFDLTLPGGENDSATMSGYVNGNGFYQDVGGFQIGSTVTGAAISLWLSDPNGEKESWAAYLSPSTLNEMFSGGGAFVTRFEATDISDYGELLVSISDTGKLDYKITSNSGEFKVDAAMLEVNATSVPDGGSTAVLMGLGFLSLAGFRKLRK
jgi:hypothetical protein